MIDANIFIPRILLCGDKAEFFSRVGQRLFDLVGELFLRDGNFLLNGNIIEHDKLTKLLRGGIDYIVFNNYSELKLVNALLYRLGYPRSQIITLMEFNNLPPDAFHDMHSVNQLLTALKQFPIKTLLEVDAYFVKSYVMTKNANDSLEIDCICQKDLPPIKENIYSRIYKDFSDCALKHYDAALISVIMPESFDDIFSRLSKTVDVVITFVRYGSALEKHIDATAGRFKNITVLQTATGNWFFFSVKKPPKSFAMYVVTHKALPPEHVQRLPEGYKIIHAGRALGKDLGYLGDDSGENISDLNPYINEMTAIYWIWKHTNHTIIGLAHYRRFFTTNGKDFLSKEQTLDFLKNYDIITEGILIHSAPSHEILLDTINNHEIFNFAAQVIRKNLMRTHPDYLDAFDYKMNLPVCYYKNMFIARRNVFDSYCDWLFSFMIDSTREVLEQTPLSKSGTQERRLMGYFAERMLTVWLIKNRLRIKEINVMHIPGI